MLRPDSVVETVMPSMAGTSRRPASVGVAPVAIWRNSGTNTVTANSAAVPRKSATLTSATVRVRSRASGTIGSAARRSCTTSAAPSASVAAISAGRPPLWMQASISVLVAPASSAAPRPSSGCAGGSTAGTGSRSRRPASAASPTGRLTRNTQRQLAVSTSAPPSSGPTTVAAAKVAAI